MPLTIKQRIYSSLLTPAPQNPALSGYSTYGDIDRSTLVFDNVSARGWFTHLNSSSTDVACLLGPIAATTHISTLLSRVYWKEEATPIINEAVLVLTRENNLGLFKVDVPTQFVDPVQFDLAPSISSLQNTYIVGLSSAGQVEQRTLNAVTSTIPGSNQNITTSWGNATPAITVGDPTASTKYLISGYVTFQGGTANADVGVRIYNNTTTTYIASTSVNINATNNPHTAHLTAILDIAPGTNSISLDVIASTGTGSVLVAPNGAGSKGVGLTAVQLG